MDKRLALSAFAALALTAAMAARADVQPGFYMGAGVGSTKIDDDGFDDIDFDDGIVPMRMFADAVVVEQPVPVTEVDALGN